MAKLQLSIALEVNEITEPIHDGTVQPENIELLSSGVASGELDAACILIPTTTLLDPIVAHNLPLAAFQRALGISRRRLEHAIKVSMTP